jgi:hypothetical protein
MADVFEARGSDKRHPPHSSVQGQGKGGSEACQFGWLAIRLVVSQPIGV